MSVALSPIRLRKAARSAGLTLVESLIAMSILAVVALGVSYATTAAHQHIRSGTDHLRGIEVAEDHLEQLRVTSNLQARMHRPQDNAGETATGYTWRIELEPDSVVLLATPVAGIRAKVTVTDPRGSKWTLSRFYPSR